MDSGTLLKYKRDDSSGMVDCLFFDRLTYEGCETDRKMEEKIMFAKVYSGTANGIEGLPVCVEADMGSGLPVFEMVGYLGAEVREARERVRTALKNSGFVLPPSHITVNLSPADLRKQGNCFDLPIALAVLAAGGFIRTARLSDTLFIGELGLDGTVRPVNGTLVLAGCGIRQGIKKAVVPAENAREGACLEEVEVYGAGTLKEIAEMLNHPKLMEAKRQPCCRQESAGQDSVYEVDFSDIRGQTLLKRATMVAAAGMHNLLYIGPPGTGKSMAAGRIPTILPPMTRREQLEVTKIYSISGLPDSREGLIRNRPFRSPHHTISPYALAGGGNYPRPGEISLAHRGVLFLDELAEFKRETLEIMRQPLESGRISLSRVHGIYSYPAQFMLAAAMNPCPCGFYPDRSRCRCSPGEIRRYRERISRPLLDRIDICAEAAAVSYEALQENREEENSASMRERVMEAMERQQFRYRDQEVCFNSRLTARQIGRYCRLTDHQEALLGSVFQTMGLSVRARDRILKVARTIADLEGKEEITDDHLAEAVGYRSIDRKFWGE